MNISVRTDWFKIKDMNSDKLLLFALMATFFCLPIGTSPPTIFGIVAIAIWVFSGKALKSKQVFFNKSWTWPVLVLIILPWIGLLYSPDPSNLGIKFAKKTHYWIYCFIVGYIAFKKYPVGKLINAFLIGLTLNTIVAIFQLAGLIPPNEFHGIFYYSGFGLGYSTLSAYLIIGLLVASYKFKEYHEKQKKLLFAILMIGYFFHLLILEGRVGYLTFLFICPFIAYNIFRGFNPFKISIICIIIIGIMFLSPIVRERIILTVSQLKYHLESDPMSAWGREYSEQQDRFYMWYGAAQIFLENPIFGVGTGGYQTVMKQRGKPEWPAPSHPHNNIIYMAVSFGLIGILSILWFFWETFRNAWKEKTNIKGFFVLSVISVIFISGLVDTQILDAGTAFLLALATGFQNSFFKFLNPHQKISPSGKPLNPQMKSNTTRHTRNKLGLKKPNVLKASTHK